MARTSKSRGASGFKMKSGNKSSFKMMGASPVRKDEFPGLLPEVEVKKSTKLTSRDREAETYLNRSKSDVDIIRGRGDAQDIRGQGGSVTLDEVDQKTRSRAYEGADEYRKSREPGVEEAKRKRLAEERAKQRKLRLKEMLIERHKSSTAKNS
tara:strand:+ start:298 stop:756 length:459 start_codon:yes stop_codon:yes gene_type:complete